MTRAKHFIRGLSSSYLLLLLNTLGTLTSLPLALHFLEKSEYTVWLVASQAASYLSMIDLGTTGSGIRLLIDCKDTPNKQNYGSLIKSMWLLQALQAGVILVIGLGTAGFLPRFLENIPPALVGDFRLLWVCQVVFLSLDFAFRIGNQILIAHQRIDISNYAQMGALLLNLSLLFCSLRLGLRLYSFIVAQAISSVLLLAAMLAACGWLKLLPPRGAWGKVSRAHLKRLFAYGSEFFLMLAGVTFITNSQVFLLTKLLDGNAALQAALVWAVMTKLFSFGTQIVWKIIGAATAAFAEMSVRGETERLAKRYRSILELSVLTSAYLGLLVAFGNNAFVEVWTRRPIQWAPVNNCLLAVWFLLLTQAFCHSSLMLYLKQVYWFKVVYLAEGVTFVLLSSVVIPRFGITGMLLCSIGCTALLSLTYGIHRVSRLMGQSPRVVALDWLLPAARFFAILLPIGIGLAYLTRGSPWLRLVACVVPLAIIGALVTLRFCLPRDFLDEILAHLPKPFRRLGAALAGVQRDRGAHV